MIITIGCSTLLTYRKIMQYKLIIKYNQLILWDIQIWYSLVNEEKHIIMYSNIKCYRTKHSMCSVLLLQYNWHNLSDESFPAHKNARGLLMPFQDVPFLPSPTTVKILGDILCCYPSGWSYSFSIWGNTPIVVILKLKTILFEMTSLHQKSLQ